MKNGLWVAMNCSLLEDLLENAFALIMLRIMGSFFFFFGPLFCDVCQIGHHSEILLAKLGYIPDMKHTKKGSFYILGNLIRTSVFFPPIF
jgi:hypothetical protein